jgi:chemotaxis signal transduction protein
MKRTGMDWDLVRSRLQSSERALDEAMTESPERIETAYRLRAARLAKGRAEKAPHGAALTVMVFHLRLERYAIELNQVAEAVRLERCTPVPGSPPLFAGVINLRGELLAVLDLARLLALPAGGDSGNNDNESGFLLLLRRRGQGIGLKVDRIEGIRDIGPEELSLPSHGKYVTGLGPGTLMLLSVDAVLAEVFSKERVL